MKRIIFFTFTLIFLCSFLHAGDAEVKLSLKDCETAALASSPKIKALEAALEASAQNLNAAGSYMLPQLNLEAGGSYVTEVPKVDIGLGALEFGDNWGYSAGPVLYYTLFDYGARSDIKKSAQKIKTAREYDLQWGKQALLLEVRLAYFKVQQDLEKIYLLSGQLEVARKQLADVKSAFNAGAKSELDVSMADQQVLSTLSQISALRAQSAADLRELFALTLTDFAINPSYPLDYRAAGAGLEAASSVIIMDDVDSILNYFNVYNYFAFDANSPKLLSAQQMAQYYNNLAQSYSSSLWPKVSLKAGAYWEYPNGPIREDVFLGRASLGLSMPLFEGSRTASQARAQRAQSAEVLANRDQAYNDLLKTFNSSKDRLSSLSIERALAGKIVADARKTYTLTYAAYKAGSVTFFEVDNANYKMTESKINLVDLKIENLARLAVIASLGK